MENFRELRNVWKGSTVFPVGMFHTEIRDPLLQSHLWYELKGFRGRFAVNGTDL